MVSSLNLRPLWLSSPESIPGVIFIKPLHDHFGEWISWAGGKSQSFLGPPKMVQDVLFPKQPLVKDDDGPDILGTPCCWETPPILLMHPEKKNERNTLEFLWCCFRLVVCVVSFLHPMAMVLKKNTTETPPTSDQSNWWVQQKPNRGFQAQWHQCHVRIQLFSGGITFKCHATTVTSITKLYDASTTTSTAYWDATTLAGTLNQQHRGFLFPAAVLFFPFSCYFFSVLATQQFGEKKWDQFASG